MSARLAFAGIGLAALLAGAIAWFVAAPAPPLSAPRIAGPELFGRAFTAPGGAPASLAPFRGRVVVLNFWATWCGPCREEMPVFSRVQARWAPRVQIVGVSSEAPERVAAFARDHPVGYPLWTGGPGAIDLSRQLGNRRSVLPFSVVLDAEGRVVEQKVGAYSEAELEQVLRAHVPA